MVVVSHLFLFLWKKILGGCEITVSMKKEDFSFKMNAGLFVLKLTCDENFNYKL